MSFLFLFIAPDIDEHFQKQFWRSKKSYFTLLDTKFMWIVEVLEENYYFSYFCILIKSYDIKECVEGLK